MATDANNNSITFSTVEICPDTIRKIEKDNQVFTVRREEIRQITLCYGTDSDHPFCQYFLGFILLFLGLFGLIVTFLAAAGGGNVTPAAPGRLVIPVLPVILWIMTGIGFRLLLGIFRAQYHLSIDTDTGTHRFFFEKGAGVMEIRQFIRLANFRFDYEIDGSVLDQMPRPS